MYLNNYVNGITGMIDYILHFRKKKKIKEDANTEKIYANFNNNENINVLSIYDTKKILKNYKKTNVSHVPGTYATHYSNKHKFKFKDIRGYPREHSIDIIADIKTIMLHTDNIDRLKNISDNIINRNSQSIILHSTIYSIIEDVITANELSLRKKNINNLDVHHIINMLNNKVVRRMKIINNIQKKSNVTYYNTILNNDRDIRQTPVSNTIYNSNERRKPRDHVGTIYLRRDPLEKNNNIYMERPKLTR